MPNATDHTASSAESLDDQIHQEQSQVDSSFEARKISAAKLRKARKEARQSRNRLFSDTTHEIPKGILKRPTPSRSVSECLEDIAKIESNFELITIDEHDDHDDNQTKMNSQKSKCDTVDDDNDADDENNENVDTSSDCQAKKKSVRFDEQVYQTWFFASELLKRRHFHFGTRHHPPQNSQHNNSSSNKKSKRKNSLAAKSGKSSGDESDGENYIKPQRSYCNLSKSQRSKQSKRDKKRNKANKSDYSTDTSSDDQGNPDAYECPPLALASVDYLNKSNGGKRSKHDRKDLRNNKGVVLARRVAIEANS